MTAFEEPLDSLRRILGIDNVLTAPSDQEKYVRDWFGRLSGQALAVARPANTNEVADVVKVCKAHAISLVPQGGNTGLVGGAIPDTSQTQIVISLERMNRVLELDPAGKTLIAQAGATLSTIHESAAAKGLEFPLTMGSQGSCTVGGLLATNAGGTAVLRYGNARALCLGLEVVTAEGRIWNGLRRLRKDNTGFDLRDLFIGSEGTLGIITSAVLSLIPAPKTRLAAMVSLESADKAVELLALAQARASAMLTAFELISDTCLRLVNQYFPALPYPFKEQTPYSVLIEMSDQEEEVHTFAVMQSLLEEAFESELITDALIPQSVAQARKFWDIREHIPLAQVEDGRNVKHDISLPTSQIPKFLEQSLPLVQNLCSDARVIAFGHLGDGNLHFNVAAPVGARDEAILVLKEPIHHAIHKLVNSLEGSISAEHGIGSMKAKELRVYKSEEEMSLFSAIKAALDPHNLLNPGKVLLK